MARSPLFSPATLAFLEELSAHNDKVWFEKNKARYEDEVREPAREFIRQFAPHLQEISPHFVASDAKVGGSLMRVHRDVRFGKDKAPYKTNVGIQFRHELGKDVHAPGFYVHLAPGECFVGAGMYHPEPAALAAVRAAIVQDPDGYAEVAFAKPFRRQFALEGDALARAPKGFDPAHPLIDELRRKDHIAVHRLPAEELFGRGAVKKLAKRCHTAAPYMRWMCQAVGVSF